MSDVTDSKEYKELMKKMEAATKTAEDNQKYIETLKKSVDDIKSDRTTLKEKIKEFEDKKSTEGATVEQLKELLKEANTKAVDADKGRVKDRLLAKVRQKALEKGFVKNKQGQINSKLLESEIDVSKLTEDDDGDIIGLDGMLDKMRENQPYMFSKKAAVTTDLNVDPNEKKGADTSTEAFEKAGSIAEKVKIMKDRGEQYNKDQNGMLPGMGNSIGLAPDPDAKE